MWLGLSIFEIVNNIFNLIIKRVNEIYIKIIIGNFKSLLILRCQINSNVNQKCFIFEKFNLKQKFDKIIKDYLDNFNNILILWFHLPNSINLRTVHNREDHNKSTNWPTSKWFTSGCNTVYQALFNGKGWKVSDKLRRY